MALGLRICCTRVRNRNEQGMAMLEMLIVLPLLLMLLFAIAEFSVVFGRWQTVTNAAREGARTAVVYRAPCDAATVETAVRQRVRSYTLPAGIVVSDAQIVIEGVCGTSETNSRVQVTAPYQFRVIGNLAPGLGTVINTIGSSVMRNEGTG
jgi:Flp pilus assembly protein TadG